ncbi:RING-type E3 ubiquitin transferase [Ranunculus cassubicifolius]
MDKLNIWLTMLTRKHIPQVSLKISSLDDTKELVPLFFTSSVEVVDIESTFISSRKVSKHNIQLPKSICGAPHLRTLNLNSIRLPKGDSNKEVILKCHVLENLILEDCYYAHLTSFNISIPQLKVLTMKNIAGELVTTVGSCKIRISTPNLTTLYLKCCSFENYFIENCDSLVSAKVEFARGTLLSDEGKLSLDCLKNATRLEFSDWTLEVCLEFQNMLDWMRDIFCDLRSLKLVKWHQPSSTSALASLLTRSPNLEYLILELIQGNSNTSTMENLENLHSFGHHLKSVEILNFTGCQFEMKLVESVLKNAISLEELTVTVHSSRSSKLGLKDYMRQIHALPRVSSRLLTCVLPP